MQWDNASSVIASKFPTLFTIWKDDFAQNLRQTSLDWQQKITDLWGCAGGCWT